MVVRLSALHTGLTLVPKNMIIFMFLVLISVRGWVNPRAWCGRKDQVNLKIHLIGYRTRDLLACTLSIVSVVSLMPWPLYSPKNSLRYPLVREQCGPKNRSGGRGKEKNLVPTDTWSQTLGRPSRQSLCRPSYPGREIKWKTKEWRITHKHVVTECGKENRKQGRVRMYNAALTRLPCTEVADSTHSPTAADTGWRHGYFHEALEI
jgi:hypothetical protein